MAVRCDKVSFRVSPAVKRGLERVAAYNEMTLADLLRACFNVCLTGDRRYLPGWFERIALSDGESPLPPIHDTDGWRKF